MGFRAANTPVQIEWNLPVGEICTSFGCGKIAIFTVVNLELKPVSQSVANFTYGKFHSIWAGTLHYLSLCLAMKNQNHQKLKNQNLDKLKIYSLWSLIVDPLFSR